MTELKGATAIVTGSSSGIGSATALALADRGCNVVINYSSSADKAEAVAEQARGRGVEAIAVQGDVSEDASCRALAAAALEKWGRIDVLVNNAGVTKFADQRDLEALSADDFQRIYAVHVIGAYQMVRACAPAMKRQGDGAIINVSSTAALTGLSSSNAYAAAKGALNSLTKAFARVMGPEIRVNVVCPGFVDTDFIAPELREKIKEAMLSITPLQKAPVASDVADVIVWLAEGATFMTGEVIQIDSGAHLGPNGRTLGSKA